MRCKKNSMRLRHLENTKVKDMIKVAKPFVGKEEIEAVTKVLLSGNYVSGKKVRDFENKWADYVGVKEAVAVNSGTAALHIALAVLGIGPGDEVIVPPMTFFSTITAVLHQNAIPVFADIEEDTLCLDPQSFKEVITERTKAVIPVHLYGNAANMSEIMRIAEECDIKIIEDAAQAHGTEIDNRKVGSIGDIGAFSFFATKHVTTGEGGMITTDNSEWAEVMRSIRNHGMTDRHNHTKLGYNYRMSEINAAIGIEQLKKLDILNEKRIKNSEYIISGLREDKPDWMELMDVRKNIKHTYFWCPVIVNEGILGISTKELHEKLKEEGLETRYRYLNPLYKQLLIKELSPYPRGCPYECSKIDRIYDYNNLYLSVAEKYAGRIIGLPNHPGLTKKECDRIVEMLHEVNQPTES